MVILSSPTAVHLKFNITSFSTQALDLPSITTHHWKIWPCSALTGSNLVHGLDWVVNDIAKRLYYSSIIEEDQTTARLHLWLWNNNLVFHWSCALSRRTESCDGSTLSLPLRQTFYLMSFRRPFYGSLDSERPFPPTSMSGLQTCAENAIHVRTSCRVACVYDGILRDYLSFGLTALARNRFK
jgi:hypothetical protein